jgi:hypothetical protein
MKSKAILLSCFTTLSNEQLKQLIEKMLVSLLFDIDRVLIRNSTYINDVDANDVNKFNSILTCNLPDLTLHELNFIAASLREYEQQEQ